MDNVNFYDNDIAEIADLNRLSSFPQTYQERFLEALTVGRRTVSINGIVPSILSQAAPDITIRIPPQYFAVEGRIGFIAQTDILVTHPSPASSYDFYIYLMLRLDDDSDTRTNVNPTTFVQTPTARVIAELEVVESTVLNVAGGGGAPTPPIGVGVPGAGSERLGFVLRATFTWDGTAAVPTINDNAADNVRFGSAGIIPHGMTHVSTDPIPYPTNTARGLGSPRALPYWKNAISRVEPAAGSPVTATVIGSNGPAGDTNYDVYSGAAARGFELDFDFATGSYQIVGTTFTPRFAAPPDGTQGTALTHARSDHGHAVLETLAMWKDHNGVTHTNITKSFTTTPVAPSAIDWGGGYANKIVMLQVELLRTDNSNLRSYLRITGGSGMIREVEIEATGNGAPTRSQSHVIWILANGTGGVTIVQGDGPSKYKIALLGVFGQGV